MNGEEIKLTAKAAVNIGKVNSKWSPVSESTFSNVIDHEFAELKFNEKIEELAWKGFNSDGSEDTTVTPS